ncbi:hypothetical protein [Bradyrhizobium diversitatis]|uniref:Uncharacterized protein n=1 Tax=Bradyrhizobium diversitatis TaxID=2755406 RepID=A0ABS0P766_9BRAD|nr:hypothetical protein [Bradyrhizobium diversitatis]MBH5389141.1 hypothetical protein [Bradyrhizobium diversitatis]
MSRERARPWRNPTPLEGFTPEWLGQFDTFEDWVNHASRALTELTLEGGIGNTVAAICVDTKGRRCSCGHEFMRARDDGSFPIRYFITGTVALSSDQ